MEEMGMGSIFKNALKNQIKTTSPDFFFSIRLTDSSLPLRIYLHAILQMSYSRFYNSKVARHEVWLDTELFSMVIVLKNSDNNIVKWFGIFDTLAWNLFFKKKILTKSSYTKYLQRAWGRDLTILNKLFTQRGGVE